MTLLSLHRHARTLLAAPLLAGAVAATALAAAPAASAAPARHTATTAVTTASHYRGVPYVYGGTSVRGFDCSGYVQYVYRKVGISLPRTAEQQWEHTQHIPRGALRPGDLVFFGRPGGVYHVGIYAGHNKIWHAPHSGTRVQLSTIWGGAKMYGRVHGIRK